MICGEVVTPPHTVMTDFEVHKKQCFSPCLLMGMAKVRRHMSDLASVQLIRGENDDQLK